MYTQRTSRKRRHWTALLLLAVVALLATSCSGRSEDTGGGGSDSGGGNGGDNESGAVVDTADCPDTGTAGTEDGTITLASSFPQSGLTAAFAQISKGYLAYFDKLNAD